MAALTFPLIAVGAVFGMHLHDGAEGAAASSASALGPRKKA